MSWRERPYADDAAGPWRSRPRFSDNPLGWSLRLGSVSGITIRVHLWFIIFVVFEAIGPGDVFFNLKWLSILFGTVLLHEFGHCFAARAVGGAANEVLLWPLGGLAFVQAPRTAWAQFVTAAGGPAVNVAICLLLAPVLTLITGTWRAIPLNPFDPFHGMRFVTAEWQLWLVVMAGISWVLLLFNLVPMYPLDGGRIFQTALWPYVGHRRSMEMATTAGMVGAILLGLLGLSQGQLMLVGVAVFGYLTCIQERRMVAAGLLRDEGFGVYDVSSSGGRRSRDGWLAQWRARRAQKRWSAEHRARERDEAEVDRILLKVHEQGLQSLTRPERKILETATRRRQAETGA